MFIKANSVFSSLFKKYGLDKYAENYALNIEFQNYCDKNLPPHLKNSVSALYVDRNVFWVEVEANAVAQEIQLRKLEILKSLNKKSSKKEIKDIRCKIKKK